MSPFPLKNRDRLCSEKQTQKWERRITTRDRERCRRRNKVSQRRRVSALRKERAAHSSSLPNKSHRQRDKRVKSERGASKLSFSWEITATQIYLQISNGSDCAVCMSVLPVLTMSRIYPGKTHKHTSTAIVSVSAEQNLWLIIRTQRVLV